MRRRAPAATAVAALAATAAIAAAPGHDPAGEPTARIRAAGSTGAVTFDATPDVDALLSRGQGLLSLPLDDAARQQVAAHLLAPDLVPAPTLAATVDRSAAGGSRPEGGAVVLVGHVEATTALGVAGRTPDLDRDGVGEVAIAHGESTTVVSGASGRPLWSTDLQLSPSTVVLADVDGDGVPELAATRYGSTEITQEGDCNGEDQGTCTVTFSMGVTVQVRSGRTGATLYAEELRYAEQVTETVDLTGRERTTSLDIVDLDLVTGADRVAHGLVRAELTTTTRTRIDSVTGLEEVGEHTSSGTLRLQPLALDGTPRGGEIGREVQGSVGVRLLGPTPRGRRPAVLVTELVAPDDRWICAVRACVDERAPQQLRLSALDPDGTERWTRHTEVDTYATAQPITDLDGDGAVDVVVGSWSVDEPDATSPDGWSEGIALVTDVVLVDGASGATRWELDDVGAGSVLEVVDGDLWLVGSRGTTTFTPDGGTVSEATVVVRVRGGDGKVLDRRTQVLEASFGEGDTPVSTFFLALDDHDADELADVPQSIAILGEDGDRSLARIASTRTGAVLYEHDVDELQLVQPGHFDVEGDGAGDLQVTDPWWRMLLTPDATPTAPPTEQRLLRMPGARPLGVPLAWQWTDDLDRRPGSDALEVADDRVTARRGLDGARVWAWRP